MPTKRKAAEGPEVISLLLSSDDEAPPAKKQAPAAKPRQPSQAACKASGAAPKGGKEQKGAATQVLGLLFSGAVNTVQMHGPKISLYT